MTVYCVEFEMEPDFNGVFSTLERAKEYINKVIQVHQWWRKSFHEIAEKNGWMYEWHDPYYESTGYCIIEEREIDGIPEAMNFLS